MEDFLDVASILRKICGLPYGQAFACLLIGEGFKFCNKVYTLNS